jgi:hypothetical protein
MNTHIIFIAGQSAGKSKKLIVNLTLGTCDDMSIPLLQGSSSRNVQVSGSILRQLDDDATFSWIFQPISKHSRKPTYQTALLKLSLSYAMIQF